MKHAALLLLLFLTSCSKSKMATFTGSTIGATGGAVVGGPGGAATGAILGYGSGIVYDWATTEENHQTLKDLENLTKGDVSAIVASHMANQDQGFGKFLSDLKKILIIAAAGLLVYLTIPFFYAKKCSKDVERKITRSPFPNK